MSPDDQVKNRTVPIQAIFFDVSLFEKKWLDIFCSHLKSGDSILDVGCGSGTPIAEYFIQKQYKVTGVDFSPNMLKMTSERFPQQEWILQDMREIHLNRQFDGIISWNGYGSSIC